MIPHELPATLLAQAEGMFARLSDDEATVVRLHASGMGYADIAVVADSSVSSVKSAMARACRKARCTTGQIAYLVGVHDARAHARALREETVHVVITRSGTTHRLEV